MLLQERRLGLVAGAWLSGRASSGAGVALVISQPPTTGVWLRVRLQDHQGRPAHNPLLRFGAVHAADRDRPGRLSEAPKSVRASRVAQNFGTRPVRARCSRGSLRVPAMTLSDCSSARACGRRVAPELDGTPAVLLLTGIFWLWRWLQRCACQRASGDLPAYISRKVRPSRPLVTIWLEMYAGKLMVST